MGDRIGDGLEDELPLHTVFVGSFYIGQYEVTRGEFETYMGYTPHDSHGDDENLPVYSVGWNSAVRYCNALSEYENLTPCYDTTNWTCNYYANGYRLPTEAEWEYAARGGIHESDNFKYSGSNSCNYVAVTGNGHPEEGGTKSPNQLNIYDMSGNVNEWCNDWFSSDTINPPNYYETCYNIGSVVNPLGPESSGLISYKVLRGGSWNWFCYTCSVSYRQYFQVGLSNASIGFRVVRKY